MAVLQARFGMASAVPRFTDPGAWLYDYYVELDRELAGMEAPLSEREAIRDLLVKATLYDYGNNILGGGYQPEDLTPASQEDWNVLKNTPANFSDPDKVEQFLRKYNYLTSERQSALEDMRWILMNRTLRDREQCLRSQKLIMWPELDRK
jgi:hypothetical protein